MASFDDWYSSNSLCHHGIKGQKWGIRRYQNADGSYTDAGKERYGGLTKKDYKEYKRDYKKLKYLQTKYDAKTQYKRAQKYDVAARKLANGSLGFLGAGLGLLAGHGYLTDVSNRLGINKIDVSKTNVNSFRKATAFLAGLSGAVSLGLLGASAVSKLAAHVSRTRIKEIKNGKGNAKIQSQIDKMMQLYGDIYLPKNE